MINQGKSPYYEEGLQELLSKNRARIRASQDYTSAIMESDVTFIIVPTPSDSNGFFSNQYILKAIETIAKVIKNKSSWHTVVITSTVMPGSVDGVIKKQLEELSGKKVGVDIGLSYSPEFIALGTVVRDMLFPDFVLVGSSDPKTANILDFIYRQICGKDVIIKAMNLINAEIVKISVNTFITTKISYANMLAEMCDKLPNADAEVVLDAVGTDKRVGNKYLKCGLAYGGPCFARDNIAFSSLTKQLQSRDDIASSADKINQYQSLIAVNKVKQFLEPHHKVTILGLTYKSGTSVIEESPSLKIAEDLQQAGYQVTVWDSLANHKEVQSKLNPEILVQRNLKEAVSEAKLVLIAHKCRGMMRDILEHIHLYSPSDSYILDCSRILPQSELQRPVLHLGRCQTPENHSLLAEMIC